MKNLVSNEWGQTFFNELYWQLFMKRSQEVVQKEVEIITQLSGIKENNSALDVCCGVADIVQHLPCQKKAGIEWSEDYVKLSQIYAPSAQIYHANALHIALPEKYDLVYNWYSSFAYFDNQKNQQLLFRCSSWLKEGGVFLMEAYNAYNVIRNFKSLHEYEHTVDGVDYHTTRKSTIDWTSRRLNQTWEIKDNLGHTKTYETFTLLYFMDELVKLCKFYFKDIEVFGRNAQGELEVFSIDSVRYVIKARKHTKHLL